MTVTAVCNKSVGLVKCVLKGLCAVHRENGRELFVGKLLGNIYALNLADKDLGVLGYFNTGKSGDLVRALANDLCVKRSVDDNRLSNLVKLVVCKEMTTALYKFGLYSLVYVLHNDNRLLGCADHTVVKGLGVDNRVYRKKYVGRGVDDGGSVTCANADCGLAGGVCALYHSGATGGKDNVGLLHYGVCHLEGGRVYPADNSLGRTCGNSRLKHNLCRRNGRALCSGVGADDNTVSRLKSEKCLEYSGRGGVGGGDYRRNNADRLGNLLDAKGLVLFNNATGLGVLVCVVNILCGIVVFDNLVFNNAHSGFRNGSTCQRNSRSVSRARRREEDLVNLLLCVGRKFSLRLSDALNGRKQALV